jgi:guanine deaminase
VASGDGGPFGAVVAQNDSVVISAQHNTVLKHHDATAHAEMQAIRAACAQLGRFDLSDCVLYSTSEPCPMCLSAAIWARIPSIYYGCTRRDAEAIGFDDNYIYNHIRGKVKHPKVTVHPFMREEALVPFEVWREKVDKTPY